MSKVLAPLCGARLRGKPGQRCRRSPVLGRTRCKFHGGYAGRPRGSKTAADGARKPGPKPKYDPALAGRRKLRSRLLRGADADLAATIPIVEPAPVVPRATPRKSPQVQAQVPDAPPPWPADGYAGTVQARELEKAERNFITALAAPIDLDRLLDRATGYAPRSGLSARDVDAALTAFCSHMRQFTDERLATFAQAEEMFRAGEAVRAQARFADAGACQMRLARLRHEADDYLTRLAAAKTLLTLRMEASERAKIERAAAFTERAIGHHIEKAQAQAEGRRPRRRPGG
jgi:hypothetical protein